jgi:hypothetical protein
MCQEAQSCTLIFYLNIDCTLILIEWSPSVRIDGHSVFTPPKVTCTTKVPFDATRRVHPAASLCYAIVRTRVSAQRLRDGWLWYRLPHRECPTVLVRCVVARTPTQPLLTPISELEDILTIPENAPLSLLDATLKRSTTFCASYHGARPTCAHARHAVLTLGTWQNNIYRAPYSSSTHANSSLILSSLRFTRNACARS